MKQGTEEWLEWRKDKIGASDASIIMGVGFITPYQLWLRKKGIVEEPPPSYPMKYGVEMEPKIREEFYRMTDISVMPKCCVHPEYDWMVASLDGMSADGKKAVEIKAHLSSKDYYYAYNNKKPPEKYYPQLQHQMAVTGLEWMYYICFYQGQHCLLEVERDDEYIEKMIEEEKKFFDCLEKDLPPALTDKDKEYRSDEEWRDYQGQWRVIVEQMEILQKKKDALREKIIASCNSDAVEGLGLSVSKSWPRGRIDYSKVEELKGVDLEKYRKEMRPVWTIRINK